MSLIIKRIELKNIRSHGHIVFEPSETGITVISGANGTGKSTIVDSIAWVLYGTKPKGVSKIAAIIKEGATIGTDECSATIELKLDDTLIKIVRKIVNKSGSVECEVYEKLDENDKYELKSGPSVSHSEKYIKKRLKMDEQSFLAAILVQQKQVDKLISATPRERSKVIENLTGISIITAAMTESRQQYNSLKKVVQLTTLDDTEIETLKEEKETLSKEQTIRTKIRDKSINELETLEKELKTITDQLMKESKLENTLEALNKELFENKTKEEYLQKDLEKNLKLKDSKKKNLTSLSSSSDFEKVESNLNSVKNKVRLHERKIDHYSETLNENKTRIKEYSEIIEKSSIKTVEETLNGLEKYEKLLKSIENNIEKIKKDKVSTKADQTKIESAIKIINSNEGTCPTCLQIVEDIPKAIKSLNDESTVLTETIENKETELKALETKKEQAIEGIEKFSILKESLEKTKDLEDQEVKLEKVINKLNKELTSLDQELELQTKLFNDVKRHAEIKEEYDSYLQASIELSDKLEILKKRKIEIEETIKESNFIGKSALNNLRKKQVTLNNKYTKKLNDTSELRNEVALREERLKNINEKIVKVENEIKAYNDLLESVEIAGNTLEIIEEFREERIKNSIPIVSKYASELLTRFTEGSFNQLSLDESFNSEVTLSNGNTRPVGLLSGGELSAAALALRLAISMLLNTGASNNALVLDEVLVSQDSERAELILSTIKEVCQGQVVMISHGPNTNEIADKVVEL